MEDGACKLPWKLRMNAIIITIINGDYPVICTQSIAVNSGKLGK